ncbi:cytochrome c biogenesis protein ResB [Nocardioides sp.]|uniref:cytochrome c biogenesis protein ResB n=1 Tax=Nocardioides sp. TaxID=35761 RepID=UPI00273473D1|nr:cytochrome c biogenesis protein ResB [Nocardioides sp.]MDP3890656.1 cytochrome c biogenesis protein ResB [Nocardioides sp.]
MSDQTTTGATTDGPGPAPDRRPGELGFFELLRWGWRQLTSMRTALVLLFLLALAAIPGSVVPQADVDALKTSRWQEEHPTLTPIYEKLGLFSVYDSVWFSAIYILLMLSLVGCIIPRSKVYWKAMRAVPPPAPRNLARLPDHTAYTTQASVDEVHLRATEVLGKRRYRVRPGSADEGAVAAERGYLREAGNLLFHLSILVVLVGFAAGSLFGYRGGVILVVGNGFSNNLTQYDDFVPGSLFSEEWMEPFSFDVNSFDAQWLRTGPRAGQAQKFVADLEYRETPGAESQRYDLRVNHPLAIGDTEIFLIGHGYAPVITITDGDGEVAYSGPTIFLPTDQSFRSFGVVKAPDARPAQIGLEGEFYPTYAFTDETGPFSAFGDQLNPAISMLVYTGDLGMDVGTAQSVYALDKKNVTEVTKDDGSMFRVDLIPGQQVDLPDGLGTVSFDGVERWNRIQISRSPGKFVALGGVSLALLGLLGSLFIRPRRVWVRARRENGGTVVDVAALDRSSGGDVTDELARIVDLLADPPKEST